MVTQVRNIELANLGAKAGAVVYTARLVGHPDFSLEAATIRVEAGSTASFAVQCKPSTTLPQVQQPSLASIHARMPASGPLLACTALLCSTPRAVQHCD